MAPSAYIKIKSGTTGAVKSIITGAGRQVMPNEPAGTHGNGYLSLDWRKKRNDQHVCNFVLDYNSPDVALLSDKDQIEVIRFDADRGLAEYTSFDGIYRDAFVTYDSSKKRQAIQFRAFSYEHFLTWRDIAYPSGQTGITKFTSQKAETILKTLVNENIGATALVSNTRAVDAVYTGFSIEADSARGNTLSIEISHQNLLNALQKIVQAAGGDFKVTRTGLLTFRFDWVVNTDRSTGASAVVFSLENANMADPKLAMERSKERTVAIVGGAGEDINRAIRVRTGPNYNASTNHIEMFVDARNSGNDNTILDGIGDIKMQEMKYRSVLEYDILQTEKTFVEQHYFLTDKIKAIFAGTSVIQYVDEVIFAYRDNKEVASVATLDV